MRERWFGATGRRVPAIVLEGTLELDDALVVDSIDDRLDVIREAHGKGTPVVARAATADEVVRALTRPEVASVVVSDPALLDLDLVELTYG